jgi:hypothetical protein
MTGMRGIALSNIFRTSHTIYRSRPASNRKAARRAWDHFAQGGQIEWMRLLDGYWGVHRPGGDCIEEVEAISLARRQ